MLTVLKMGGSVLAGACGYRRAAAFISDRLGARPRERLLVVVSAEFGTTDALQASARDIVDQPDAATLDLLWSTGEIRSAAVLTLCLHAAGARATALNAHQTGLVQSDQAEGPGHAELHALGLRAALAASDVVVVPGFLARAAGGAIVSLGRGGSDLTAVLLAAGLGARHCELIKDVPGYFSADPHLDASARQLPAIDFPRALAMADAGCALVQRQALEVASRCRLPLVVRGLDGEGATIIT